MAKVDSAISLIPHTFHATVIKSAIRKKKNVVGTSYVSRAMTELEDQVKRAGIMVMNEIVSNAGGKIKSFLSYSGHLPPPETSDNPLGYKCSRSSRDVLLAFRTAAKSYQDGSIKEIADPELMSSVKPYFIYPRFAFVTYQNRDSTPYQVRYNIPEAQTVIPRRATIPRFSRIRQVPS
ncbi:saccharopine dehydrogenase [NADP(+), L-glutamate-forming] [Rhinocladiella mackenziei CBS 650.93]|uniref:Saccharopine dehydrogenase [NADP(+), L-glutamate-forming] n=1 Tax=Rhinocladiella mackenziei CBS 650.93 TaxID=1442369 RepID=A0A0D2IWK8_9EURO|nr:saccharopine dehydrogenase [NADP(+), L-glutamate-forming] [Rhinocladiella mackenziei CBS 650.93]KIX10384.1 saccharopine dehydrogenase [NADP(+), L-glutamate-forming] [Rhinocladiella mackenziei CBS 650.93]